MAWTSPRTWLEGETVTASMLNAQLRDNLIFLKGRVSDAGRLLMQDGDATSPGLQFENDSNTGIFRSGTDELNISTAGVRRILVGSTGGVTIGGVVLSTRFANVDVNGLTTLRHDNNAIVTPLTLENRNITAANQGLSLLFNLGDSSPNAAIAAGYVRVLTEQDWTSTTSTQDAKMIFAVALNGTVTERVEITSGGSVLLAKAGALATTATDGFTYVPTCAGTPTGVPTAQTGMVAMVFDTTNNKLWVYDGAWIGVVLA